MEETRFYRLRKGFVLPAEFGAEDVNKQKVTANNITTETETQKYRRFVNDLAPAMTSLERAITNLFTGSKAFIDYEHNLVVLEAHRSNSISWKKSSRNSIALYSRS